MWMFPLDCVDLLFKMVTDTVMIMMGMTAVQWGVGLGILMKDLMVDI